MKNFYFNLNQLPSKNDGGQSCDGNRQSRLMLQSGCGVVDVPMTSYGAPDEHPMSIRSASDGTRWNSGVWKHVAMIFAVLVMSVANIGTAWGETYTWSFANGSGTISETTTNFTSTSGGKTLIYDGGKSCSWGGDSGNKYLQMGGKSSYSAETPSARFFKFLAPSSSGTVSISYAGTVSNTEISAGSNGSLVWDVITPTANETSTSKIISGLTAGSTYVYISCPADKSYIKSITWTDAALPYERVYYSEMKTCVWETALESGASFTAHNSAIGFNGKGGAGWNSYFSNYLTVSSSGGYATATFSPALALTSNGVDKGRIRVYFSGGSKNLSLEMNGSSAGSYSSAVNYRTYVAEYTIPDATENLSTLKMYQSGNSGIVIFAIEVLTYSSSTWYLPGSWYNNFERADAVKFTGSPLTLTLHLDEHTSYDFKLVKNNGSETWYDNSGGKVITTMKDWSIAGTSGGNNSVLFTGPEGDYTFTLDPGNQTLDIDYPNIHPDDNYMYFENTAVWGTVGAYIYSNDSWKVTSWDGTPSLANSTVEICGHTYHYCVTPRYSDGGTFENVIFRNLANTGQSSGRSAKKESHGGKWSDNNSATIHDFNLYTISFAGNGNTGGTMDAITGICPNSNRALPANTFEKTDNIFQGWKANVDVTINSATVTAGTVIADGATIQNITGDITLTAQWAACTGPNASGSTWTAAGYTYELNATANTMSLTNVTASNGGALSYQWYKTTSDVEHGEAIPGATSNTYTPATDVAHAANWYYFCRVTEAGCSTTYTSSLSGAIVVNPAATYDIIYAANLAGAGGGTASTTGKSAGYTEAAKACGYSKSGYKFKWWNTAPDGTGEDFYVGETVTLGTGNLTLYAQWETVASNEAYWIPISQASQITGSAINITEGDMNLNSGTATDAADLNINLTADATQVNKTGSTPKHAKVLAIKSNDKYIEVKFTDGSPINKLYLGATTNKTADKKAVVIYSTTADFSSGEYYCKEITLKGYENATKGIYDVSPATTNKYLYARIYRKVSTAVYSQTFVDDAYGATTRIYSIKAQKGTVASTYTDLSVTKDPAAGSATDPTISATSVTQGSSVTVTAGAAASGYVFIGWTSENGTFADPNSTTTTFTPNANNAVATAHYAATKTIVIKIKNDENKDGWDIQGITTYPADQSASIKKDGDWVKMTFSNVYAVSNINLAYSGGDWDYLNTSTKITDNACYSWAGAAISCAELTAIEADVLYQAADMANITFTGSDQTFTGLSTNNLFKVYGTDTGDKSTTTAAFGKNETISDITDDISKKSFTSALYITAANNTSNTSDPTQGAIEFITPSTSGILYLYLNSSSSGLSIKKKGASSSTSLSGAAYKKINVDANTHYFINGSGSNRGLYGIQYVSTYGVTITTTNVAKGDGGATAIKGKAYTATFTANTSYTLPSDVTVTIGGASCTKGTEYTWSVSDDTGTLTVNAANVTGNIVVNVTGAAPATYSITYDCDGASSGCPTDVAAATNLPSPLPSAPTKDGYTFDGWYTNSEKTVDAVAGAALTGNVILYAKWTEDTGNKVTYNGNENTSGSVPTDDTDYAAGEIVTVKGNTGNLVKTGQTFLGWNTADDYTGTFYPADYKFAMPASAVTLYAVWGTGQVCYTITDFETTTHNSSSGNPDGQGKYFYGYMGTKDTEHAVTITAPNTNNVGMNSGANMQVYSGNSVYIYADNTTTGGTPATFSGVTSISFKIKATKNTKIPTIDVYVGTTKIGTVTGGSEASDSDGHEYDTSKFTTITFSSLSNLSGIVKFTNTNSGSSDYKALIDDIEICTGSGSSGYTVTFNNNGEGEYSRTISNVPSGSKIGEPIPDPTASGNTFAGWYKETGCTNAWNFATETVTADKTLYAKWTNCLPTITTQPVGNTYTRGLQADAMTIVASGNVTGYQWFSNDEDNATTGTPIDGQTTGGYTPTTGVVGTTYYYCVVSNDCGSVASNVVAIVVNDDKLTPCAVWTVDAPTHGGQGFSFSVVAKKQDGSNLWDGILTEGMLTVSEGVILGAITVNNGTKTISGTYGVSGTAESPVTFYLSLPRTDTHSAALLSHTEAFTACAGGAGEVEIPVLSGTTDGGSVKDSPRYWWETAGNGRLFALNYGKSDCASTSDDNFSSAGFNYVTSSNTQRWVFQPYIEGVTKIRIYIKSATNGLTLSSIGGSNNWADQTSKYSSVTTSSITYGTANATNFSNNEKGYIEITFGSALTANKYYMFAMSSTSTYIYGVKLYSTAATDAGTITPTLGWSPSIDGNVEKNENAADFTYTATRSNDKAVASLGTISYSSSNTSVATVNATTGQVTIAGNIDFGSADHIDVTITATLSASGCYKKATNTYTLRVKKYVCTEAAGTVTVTGESGCGKVLTISGYEEDASIQWYKDGEVITGAIGTSYTATSGGTYYAITHKGCYAVSNELTISTAAATAKKIVDEWYVKKGRRTPDIALVQTTNATGFTVSVSGSPIWKSDETETTGFAGCGFYLGEDGIIYLKGETNNGKEPAKDDGSWAAGDVTLSITATACANADPVEIKIHKQASTDKPSIAFVVDGGVGKAVNNVSETKTSNRALWTYLTEAFTLTGCNIYWTTDEKALRQYYSQYDAILITDDPNTRQYPGGKDEEISATKGYVNAMGTLIDVRPMLTMEAYVSRLANWDCVKGTPYSPSPRDYVLKLQCKEHAIYKDLEKNGTTVRQEVIDGIDHWYVTMVDASNKTYADTDDETDATGTPALQGFDGKVNAGMLGIGTIANETLQGGIERQAEPAARMMVLGINNKAMAALTDPGKKVIMNALTYLLHTDMETLEDCSNYFHGQEGTNTNWFTAANWSAGKVPDPTVRAVILAPCEIAGATPARASSVDIAVGGKTGRYKSGASDCEGHLTIAATGALVVSEGVRRIEDAPNFGVDSRKPTQTSDLYIASTSENGNGTLIFDNPDGNTQATVGYYSKATTDEAETWNWQYMAVPFNDNSSAYRNYYDSYLYRWAENCSGWEVVPNRGAVYPWVGYTITQVGAKMYYMDGTLVETGEQTFTVPTGADLVLGNSWTAPLQIKQFEDDDFDGLQKKVYLFNTGYDPDGNHGDASERYEAGTYVVVPIHSSSYTGDSLISSLQAFTVTTDGGEGTLTLDYERHVRPARSTDKVNAGPMHAPRRAAAREEKPTVLKIWASGNRFDDRLVVLEREDFSTGSDDGWDGEKVLMGEMAPTIYTVMENGYESVTATNDYEGTLIGFKAGEDNEYTFHFEYDDMAEPLFLLDMDERMYVRILTGTTYTFTCADKGEHNRFLLTRNAPGIATGCEPIDGGGGPKAMKFIKDNKLYILLNGVLYDATGKIVVR